MRLKQSLLSFLAFLAVLGAMVTVTCLSSPVFYLAVGGALMFLNKLANVPCERQAVECMRFPADHGTLQAQSLLGRYYSLGMGFPQDYEEAIKWLTKAADQGDQESQLWLGYDYMSLDNSEKDLEKAFQWFQKAGNQGCGQAEMFVGSFFHSGIGTAQDMKKAFEWLRRSAEHGDPNGQLELARLYQFGQGTKVDQKLATKWYERVASQGISNAQYALSLQLINGRGAPRDEKRAMELIREAAEHGHAQSQLMLGAIEAYGLFGKANFEDAQKWLNRVHEQKLPSADYLITALKNNSCAQARLTADAQNKPEAQAMLAKMLETGIGRAQNYSLALSLYKNAAGKGNSDAQLALADWYYMGAGGLPCDPKEEMTYLSKSAEGGNSLAQAQLAQNYLVGYLPQPGMAKIQELLEASAAHGNIEGQYALGIFVQRKANSQTNAQSESNLRKAAEAGDVRAQERLSNLLLRNGKSLAEVTEWRTKAADQGYVPAIISLSESYSTGIGVKANEVKAARLREEAVQQGDIETTELTASYLRYGIFGMQRNEKRAAQLYKICAEAGRNDAQYALGEMYYFGQGVDEDKNEAKKWWELAAAQGNKSAINKLTNNDKTASNDTDR